MIFLTYFRFLSTSLLKKKSIWVFGLLYLIFSFLLLIIVPIITGNTPWTLWHSVALNPQTILMYVAVIFGAIISIAVFKEYRDDGTELILVTKPINRVKATVAKFTLFFSFTFAFTLITLINAPITLIFKDVTVAQVNSLVISMLFANFIILVVFGMLATLISLFANKIWTILTNVIVIVLLMIVSTVNALVVKTPAALAKDDSHSIVSAQYLANDGQFHSFASLTPTMEIKDGNISISFTTLEQEKNQWQNYNNQSTSSFANFFDFAGQFNLLNNLGLLQNEMTKDASDSFGVNRFYDYQLQNRVLDTKTDYLPYYYVKMPKSFGSLGKFELNEESVENLFLKYFQLMSDQTIVMIGRSQVDTSSLISSVLPRNFYVAKGNNGWSGINNNVINYTYQDLAVDQKQQDVFNRIIEAFLGGGYDDNPASPFRFGSALTQITDYLDSDSKNAPTWDRQSDQGIFEALWNPSWNQYAQLYDQESFRNVLDEDSLENCTYQIGASAENFIHACIVGSNKGFTNLDGTNPIRDGSGEYKNVFWDSKLTSPEANEALMKTIAMFKLYAFEYLTKYINNLHQYANNTHIQVSGYDFDSQPILPLNVTTNQSSNQYIVGDDMPVVSIPWGILSTIYPSAEYDLAHSSTPIAWPDKNIRWANGNKESSDDSEPSYLTDPNTLRARAFLDWIINQQKYGYNDAVDSGLDDDGDPKVAFDRDQNYNVNLITTSTNFPLIYECLGSTYTAKPNIESWQIILLWTLIGALLTALSFTIYVRTDFK